jgi:hypothetical protein
VAKGLDTDKQELERAKESYESLMASVMELQALTDMPAWRKLYANVQSKIKMHGSMVLDAEKTRDIIQHQEGVKVLRGFIADVRRPVDDLVNFCNSMPLFGGEFHTRAQWNEALGTVELKSAK